MKTAAGMGREIPTSVRLAARVYRIVEAEAAAAAKDDAVAVAVAAARTLTSGEGPLDAARCAALDTAAGILALPVHAAECDAAMSPMVVALGGGEKLAVATAILGRLRAAAFTIADGEARAWGIGIFPRAALLNHDCESNCAASFSPGAGSGGRPKVNIRTLRRVLAGEELTLSYVDVGVPTARRRAALREGYGFDCACARCCKAILTPLLSPLGHQDGDGRGGSEGRDGTTFSDLDIFVSRMCCESHTCKDGEGGGLGLGTHLTSVEDHAVAPSSSSPFPLVFASPCSVCGALASPAAGAALADAVAAARDSARLLRAGDAPKALSRAAGALSVAAASGRLTPEHWALGALGAAAAHAAVAVGDWKIAIAANDVALPALVAALPMTSPALALQRAQQAKLLMVDGGKEEAVIALHLATAARGVLTAALGDDNSVVREVIATVGNAQVAIGGGVGGEVV